MGLTSILRQMPWYVYILKCADSSYYTGITNNLKRRVSLHNDKKGAKSIRGKLPAVLVYKEKYENQTLAAKREREIKSWSRIKKTSLIEGFSLEDEQEGFSLRSEVTKAQ